MKVILLNETIKIMIGYYYLDKSLDSSGNKLSTIMVYSLAKCSLVDKSHAWLCPLIKEDKTSFDIYVYVWLRVGLNETILIYIALRTVTMDKSEVNYIRILFFPKKNHELLRSHQKQRIVSTLGFIRCVRWLFNNDISLAITSYIRQMNADFYADYCWK